MSQIGDFRKLGRQWISEKSRLEGNLWNQQNFEPVEIPGMKVSARVNHLAEKSWRLLGVTPKDVIRIDFSKTGWFWCNVSVKRDIVNISSRLKFFGMRSQRSYGVFPTSDRFEFSQRSR